MIPADDFLAGRNFLEHVVHVFDIIMVEEPSLQVLVVFLKGDCGCMSLLGVVSVKSVRETDQQRSW